MDTNFGGFALANTQADIFVDPTLLLVDVEMKLNTFAAKYIRTFELFERSARFDITQGYQKGRWSGILDGTPASTSRNGLTDTVMRLALNLHGAPPLKGKDYITYRIKAKNETVIGTGLSIRLPTGNYHKNNLINLGKNRFTIRPQIGVMHTSGKWITELTGEVAFFTDNNDFFNGNQLEQKPLYIAYTHLAYIIKPGQWLSISLGYDYGGENTVNGINKNDKKQDIGLKLNYTHPMSRTIGIKVSYLGTQTKELTGFDSQSLAVGMSYIW